MVIFMMIQSDLIIVIVTVHYDLMELKFHGFYIYIYTHRIHVCYIYMVTFTINIPHMLAYIPYMDPMAGIYIYDYMIVTV